MIVDSIYLQLDNCLKECITLLDNNSCTNVLLSKLKDAQVKLHQPMQLAIIGKISSSKSTLVNAILGEPEVVRTGQMEETFNVSWLKYGSRESDIIVHFKDGHVSNIPSSEWNSWTSHQIENSLKEQVKYIEVFYPNDILKSINIIDTPGLDALSEIDSKNTIEFLKIIKPDAVIMVFTKSIAESTFEILQDFQSASVGSFSLNPLNALGVLAKVDTMWSSFTVDKDILKDGERVIQSTLYDKYPQVKKALFSILPVSALLGLGGLSITKEDLISIKQIAKFNQDAIAEMLSSPDFLFDESYNTGIEITKLKQLYYKYGLYGIYLIIEGICRDKSLDEIKNDLLDKSGFSKLLSTILAHFGERASLIKIQNSITDIISFCDSESKKVYSQQDFALIQSISKKLLSLLLSLTEYSQWEYLSKIYNGNLSVDEKTIEEFKKICGEYGNSLTERIDYVDEMNLISIKKYLKDKALYWQRYYNMYSVIDPEVAGLYKVMIKTYSDLYKRLDKTISLAKEANETIKKAQLFLGKDTMYKFIQDEMGCN